MPKFSNDRLMGRCVSCHRRLLINPETGYCLVCENEHLKERIELLEFQLEAKNKRGFMQGEAHEAQHKKQ